MLRSGDYIPYPTAPPAKCDQMKCVFFGPPVPTPPGILWYHAYPYCAITSIEVSAICTVHFLNKHVSKSKSSPKGNSMRYQ